MRTLKKHCIIKMLSYNKLIILLTGSLVAVSLTRTDFMHVIGLFPDTDSGTNSDLDSKPDDYIVLYRNCSHLTYSDSDSDSDLGP